MRSESADRGAPRSTRPDLRGSLCSSVLGILDSEPPGSLSQPVAELLHLLAFSVHQESEVQEYQQQRCLTSHPLLILEALQPHY